MLKPAVELLWSHHYRTPGPLCRTRMFQAALSDTVVLKRVVPAAMRWIFRLGPIGIYLVHGTIRGLLRKYPKEYDEEELKAALTKIRVGLQASSSGYLVGDSISFAGSLQPDIT
jgi:hypothetical protein